MGSKGQCGQRSRGVRGSKRNKGYFVLVFWIPTICVRGEESKGSKGREGQGLCYTRFLGPHHLYEGLRGEGE